jgi:hypothetical protein
MLHTRNYEVEWYQSHLLYGPKIIYDNRHWKMSNFG